MYMPLSHISPTPIGQMQDLIVCIVFLEFVTFDATVATHRHTTQQLADVGSSPSVMEQICLRAFEERRRQFKIKSQERPRLGCLHREQSSAMPDGMQAG